MPALHPEIDADGLLEYSVVFTDRSLNQMSRRFQQVMRDVSEILKEAYSAPSAVLLPGGGTFAMEAVARQFAGGKRVLVIRNGWFSYRWTQIFDTGRIPASHTVIKARPVSQERQAAFAPAPIAEVLAAIERDKPEVVFAPHVETSAGILLPDDYLRAVANAAHAVGGLFVLDCVASGALWVDMRATGVDILISAPQKGWSGSPGTGFVLLSERARSAIESTVSSSYAADLRKWLQIMETYEKGSHAYHATLPTDALARTRDQMLQTRAAGFETLRAAQQTLGERVRSLFEAHGLRSVAAPGFQAPCVVVSYTDDDGMHTGKAFAAAGLQTAAGVPLQCDEPADFKTFRVGLFGLDKLLDIDAAAARLQAALAEIGSVRGSNSLAKTG